MTRIVSILPKGEGFSDQSFGAISLCVRDFTLHSQYRDTTVVLGGIDLPGFDGVEFQAMPAGRWYENRTSAYVNECARFINENNIDLVEVHNRPRFLLRLSRKVKCRLALHLHNDPQEMDKARSAVERRQLLHMCSAVYCVSEYVRDRFLQSVDSPYKNKVHVVYNGIAQPTSLPAKENIIVFAGRMTEGKGALLLAQALRVVLPQLPEWRGVFIGSGRHEANDKLTDYEKQVAQVLEPVKAQIRMRGFLTHEGTLEHFANAHIAVVPSVWNEPFGRTALEAMAYGAALISSGRGGLKEVTADAALTLSDLNAEALAKAIMTLAENATERERLQSAGRVRAEKFSIAECTKLLDNVRSRIFAH